LISDGYREQLAQLHSERPDFGTTSPMYADFIRTIIRKYEPEDILDYGAGKQALKEALGIKEGYFAYDPAIPEISSVPKARDFVVCTDVLEHVELGMVPKVVQDLSRCVKKVGFFVIHTSAALHHLPDGRNAHLVQEKASWWLHYLIKHFEIIALETDKYGFWVIVEPKHGN
jgi:hypothetical protein